MDSRVFVDACLKNDTEYISYLLESADLHTITAYINALYGKYIFQAIKNFAEFLINSDIKDKMNIICRLLEYAILHNDNQIIRHIIKSDIEFNTQIFNMSRIFYYACKSHNFYMVKYLIEAGANIHSNDDYALLCFISKGNMKAVRYLINLGANIHASDDRAIIVACQHNNLEIVKYLIDLGANIHASDGGAIIVACRHNNLEIVKYLIDLGANIHASDDAALIVACQHNNLEIVKYLIDLGANIHTSDDKAIFEAIRSGNLEIVKYLIESGIDIHANNDKVLRIAIDCCHIDITKYLMELGIYIDDFSFVNINNHSGIIKYILDIPNNLDINKLLLDSVLYFSTFNNSDYQKTFDTVDEIIRLTKILLDKYICLNINLLLSNAMEILLDHDHDDNADYENEIYGKLVELIKILLDKGAFTIIDDEKVDRLPKDLLIDFTKYLFSRNTLIMQNRIKRAIN